MFYVKTENSIYLINKVGFTGNILKLGILWHICMIIDVFKWPFYTYWRSQNFESDFLTENWHRTLDDMG